MKVLITGGCGFIGSHVAERFFKEGHEIFIIDNLSAGSRNNVSIQHKFYNLNVADKKCEEVFRVNKIDFVIHLAAQVDVNISDRDPCLDSEANILGLVNMLDLSRKHGVKKFVFASSAAVYGDNQNLPLAETAPAQPISVYGINKSVGEEYCRRWKEMYQLDTVILRFANVYGPRQGVKGEAGVISIFMKQMQDGNDIVIYGDGHQTRDYVYVEDVADAVYRVVSCTPLHDTINISTNTECSLLDLVEMLGQFGSIKNIKHEEKRKGDIYKSRLDNARANQELNWQPKYTLKEGLLKTFQWYEVEWVKCAVAATAAAPAETGALTRVRPYLENFALFAIMVALSYLNNYGHMNSIMGLDYNYVYIAVMGFLYGKKQSLLATALSTVLLIHDFVIRGADLVAIVYQSQYLFHFATYLFVGVVTGYSTDNRERIALDRETELANLKERYEFLENMYLEGNQIRDRLYAQIVNSDNSFGKTYGIVSELDSLEIENIYTAANTVVSETMRTKTVAIYTVSENGYFLRQKTKMGAKLDALPKSMKIDDFAYLQQVMQTKRIFVNKNVHPEYPDMAAPIMYGNRVIAVIMLYDLPFEGLTYYYENLLKITVMLISDALAKAYLYEMSIQEKKYVASTRILIAEEFAKVQAEFDKREESHGIDIPTALLRINASASDYKKLSESLTNVIRAEDYIGLKQDGNVYILLVNINDEMVSNVQERIKKSGFDAVRVLGEQYV